MRASSSSGICGFFQSNTLAFVAVIAVTVLSVIILITLKAPEGDEELARDGRPGTSSQDPSPPAEPRPEDVPQASPPPDRGDSSASNLRPAEDRKVLTLTVTDDTGSAPPVIQAVLKTPGGKKVYEGPLKAYRGNKYFLGAVPGAYSLEVTAQGCRTSSRRISLSDFGTPVQIDLKADTRHAGVSIRILEDKDQLLTDGFLLLRTEGEEGMQEFFLTAHADGIWASGDLPPGQYWAFMTRDRLAPRFGVLYFSLLPGQTRHFSQRVPMADLTGTVTDAATGKGIPQAKVFLFPGNPREGIPTQIPLSTDGSGCFAPIHGPAGRYIGVARARGYGIQMEYLSVRAGETGKFNIKMRPATGLPVQLRGGGKTLPKTIHMIVRQKHKRIFYALPLSVDAYGHTRLDISPGRHNLILEAPGFQEVDLRLKSHDFKGDQSKIVELRPLKK